MRRPYIQSLAGPNQTVLGVSLLNLKSVVTGVCVLQRTRLDNASHGIEGNVKQAVNSLTPSDVYSASKGRAAALGA